MRAGALFAGIGGFCIGFQNAGIPTAWAIDNDPHAKATYAKNLGSKKRAEATPIFIDKDIREISVSKQDLEPVEVLHAGFPCQSFSQAGERRGFDDPRGQLFFEIIRIVREFKDKKPKVLVLENSPYLRYGEGGLWFITIQREIQRAGYWFREANCAELDAFKITALPQQRTRLFMVAFSTSHFKSGRFQFPTETSNTHKRLDAYIDFEGKKEREYYLDMENRYYKMINGLANDKRRLYQLRKYEVRAKEPNICPTLTANMGLGGHNVPFLYDAGGLRKLTEQECIWLQGFPEKFCFPDSVPRAKRYIQAGNAVTVPVAQLVAERVKRKLLEESV